jgi:hypothetical protein
MTAPRLARWLALVAWLAAPLAGLRAAEPVREGTVTYTPAANEHLVAERFRLPEATFAFRQQAQETVCTKIAIWEVTFPSPVVTPHPNNNTVHCEYFQPLPAAMGPAAKGPGAKGPGVIVLHILGGDFDLSRLFCRTLAHRGVAALFVKLPYYGPRRQPEADVRMVSRDPRQTVEGMTQAVLDIRRARAWLAAQEEVDPQQTGIFGISLGGITSALAAAAEPRFAHVCLMLAGGDMGQVGWTSPELAEVRRFWQESGQTKEAFYETLRPIDPVTYAASLRGRRVLMLNARYDEVIPPACTLSLWRALGEPEIVWLDAGHYSAMRFIFEGLAKVTRFFEAAGAPAPPAASP